MIDVLHTINRHGRHSNMAANRRRFLKTILIAACLSSLLPANAQQGASAKNATTAGLAWYKHPDLQIQYGAKKYSLIQRKTITEPGVFTAQYDCAALPALKIEVRSAIKYKTRHKTIVHEVSISSGEKLKEDLRIYFPVRALHDNVSSWLPLKNGTGRNVSGKISARYQCAGLSSAMANELAIPLIVVHSKKGQTAVTTDPYFSSLFEGDRICWTYAKEVGLEDKVEKRWIAEASDIRDPDDAINVFYAAMLPDVPAGPSWTKDIAMISYDFMSDDGKGWFNDIDSLTGVIAQSDRHKILLTLHGWYDCVGRYAFNPETKRFDSVWPSRLRKNPVTLADLHHRIQYAKDRGFKVAMYFADGITSSDSLSDYSPDKAIPGGGWAGPDMYGKAYRRNIAVPEYYGFYLNYATALFNEFAKQADMFVWDETYYIKAGHLGTEKYRSYLDRKFMRLVKTITGKLHEVNPDAAFMASDLIGPDGTGYGGAGNDYYADIPPYALLADGDYQDSNCQPMFWSYGIFPNYRNAMWSCNWTPVTAFDLTLFSTLQYQAPVVFTNGWGDDVGFSELDPLQKKNLLSLFDYRKNFRTQLKWMTALPPFIRTCGPVQKK